MKNSQNIATIMTVVAIALGALATTGLAASSLSYGKYTTRYGLRGVGDASDASRFDILQNAGSGATDYWCAAGEYAIHKLGLTPTTRLYLVQPLGKGRLGRNSIGFSSAPTSGGVSSNGLTMSMNKVGQNWTVSHARAVCGSDDFRNR